MSEIKNKELLFIEEFKKKLATYGKVELMYISAEFEPFSNQQKPELVFTPNNNDQRKDVYVIEYKTEPTKGFDDGYTKLITEHKEFILSEENVNIKYVFVTNGSVNISLKSTLTNNDIAVFDNVSSVDELSEQILLLIKK